MPEEANGNIFKPCAGSAREGGTGLGLSIAQDIMRAHGGDIRLERSGSEGTLFRLVLPLRPAPAQPAAKASSRPIEPEDLGPPVAAFRPRPLHPLLRGDAGGAQAAAFAPGIRPAPPPLAGQPQQARGVAARGARAN